MVKLQQVPALVAAEQSISQRFHLALRPSVAGQIRKVQRKNRCLQYWRNDLRVHFRYISAGGDEEEARGLYLGRPLSEIVLACTRKVQSQQFSQNNDAHVPARAALHPPLARKPAFHRLDHHHPQGDPGTCRKGLFLLIVYEFLLLTRTTFYNRMEEYQKKVNYLRHIKNIADIQDGLRKPNTLSSIFAQSHTSTIVSI